MLHLNNKDIPLIEIQEACIQEKNSKVYVLREDLIHPEISGNKWRKLKYNIVEAKNQHADTLLTFGGAYSNHIAATAAAGANFGLNTIGVIRGEETIPLNNTLKLAQQKGMQFKYISRIEYRQKNQDSFINKLSSEYENVYIVPEGGSNAYAVRGCTEIMQNIAIEYDLVACACGTGGTIAGIIASLKKDKKVFGFPALKGGDFLRKDIDKLINDYSTQYNQPIENKNWDLILDYHFGGYAKINEDLVSFVREFKHKHNIPLDLIYTGKMMYGIFDLLKNTEHLDNKTIIVVHTGGVQGNKGFEERFGIDL